jgi:tetratricopeptide (TPR) repeat protein
MEKDRTRRYETANSLALDIRRHLADEPVLASPPSTVYHFRKYVKRHRIALAFAATIFLGIAGALFESNRQRVKITAARDELVLVTSELQDMLASAQPGVEGRDVTVREMLDKTAKTIGLKFEDRPEVEANLRDTIGDTYLQLGRFDEAETHLARAFDLRRTTLGEEHPETLSSGSRLATAYLQQGRYEEGEALSKKVLEVCRRVLGDEHLSTLDSMGTLAWALQVQRRSQDAQALFQQKLEISRRVLGEEHPLALSAMRGLANVLEYQGWLTESEALHRESLEIRKRVLGEEHPSTTASMVDLSVVYREQGRYPDAEALLQKVLAIQQRVLGEEHRLTLGSRFNLAIAVAARGRYDEAEALHLKTLATRRLVLGEEHPETIYSLACLGMMYWRQGRHDKAEELNREAVAIARRVLGEKNEETLCLRQHLPFTYQLLRRPREARSVLTELVPLRRESAENVNASPGDKDDCARLLLTCEPTDFRDPNAALKFALEANEQTNYSNAAFLATLALAYYLTGQTALAVDTQRDAIAALHRNALRHAEFETRLAEYETVGSDGPALDALTDPFRQSFESWRLSVGP